MVHVSDDYFGTWDAEFFAAERGARALRDGARWIVLSRHVERASEISHSQWRFDISGDSGEPDGAQRNFRGADFSFRICCVDFLCAIGGGHVSAAAHRAGHAAAISHVGLSGGACAFFGGSYGFDCEFVDRPAAAIFDWFGDDSFGTYFLPVLEPAK